jgi:hypothetical protein
MRFKRLQKLRFGGIFLITFNEFRNAVNSPLDYFYIGENKLKLNRFNVSAGINAPLNVDNIAVFKSTHNMHNSIGFAYIRKKFIAQSLAF